MRSCRRGRGLCPSSRRGRAASRQVALAYLSLVWWTLAACAVAPPAEPEDEHTVAGPTWDARRLGYLERVTREPDPTRILTTVAVAARARLDPGYEAPAGIVGAHAWDAKLDKIAALRDTADFDVADLLWAWYGARSSPVAVPDLWPRVRESLLGFKYWYSDPTPPGREDGMWYWSENHQALFHADEYLAGQAFPDENFGVTGWTGAQHQARAAGLLARWMELRERFGFFEFHSNVYYAEDLRALLSLVEWADDPALRRRAQALVDRMALDLALGTFRGAFGMPHGRSYKKDKMTSLDEDTWDAVRLLFDTATYGYQASLDGTAVRFAASERYRLPRALMHVAQEAGPMTSVQRMGIPLDEHEPIDPQRPPVAPYGLDYLSEEDLPIWWSMGALTVWQTLPLTLDVLERYGLWEQPLFAPFAAAKPLLEGDRATSQTLARELAWSVSMGLLSQVTTVAYRTPDYMLATAVDFRPGARGHQQHSWQATLDARAIVFTTHPATPPADSTSWRDDPQPGAWTGSASLPRSAQWRNVAVHIYAPQYEPLPAPLDAVTAYEPYTHAYFPQDRFDEVVRAGRWTFGRLDDGYVGLWSWREPRWVAYDPARQATDGMTAPFELRAEGGPDDVWVVECGRAQGWGDFAAFQAALVAREPTVTPLEGAALPEGVERGPVFDVAYDSPSVGLVRFGWVGPLTVAGEERPLGAGARFDNPWTDAPFDGEQVRVTDPQGGDTLVLDRRQGGRRFEASL